VRPRAALRVALEPLQMQIDRARQRYRQRCEPSLRKYRAADIAEMRCPGHLANDFRGCRAGDWRRAARLAIFARYDLSPQVLSRP
jgi:hypothetical protein